ncbi:HAD-IIB family hydrolase [Mangrovitalea sediminis]|uniref:HAD-IIB family hydrolase n=1 Tax=Mangrovitalea sediminis TaxID=1982043 RepID=UPI000BE51441|nr:HAD-IIB family hydrolase [Mangrovitalea sediminis]
MMPLMVFTDLDGTLLDHETYSWEPAGRALETLRSLEVPVIPVSSKTIAEIAVLARRIGLRGPLIGENGNVIGLPREDGSGWKTQVVGTPYLTLRSHLAAAQAAGFPAKGFGDMTPETIASLTGLDREAAALARQRQASEPLCWEGSDKDWPAFVDFLNRRGLRLQRGGRFWTLSGLTDKGDAVRHLIARHREQLSGEAVVSIALGDSPNDIPMLNAVDHPVLVAPAHSADMALPENPQLLVTRSSGPAGWQWAIDHLLDKLGWS